MKYRLLLGAAGLLSASYLTAPTPVYAAGAVIIQDAVHLERTLKVNPDGSITVTGSAAATSTAVAGTQVGLAIASATALTVPTGATLAVIQAQGVNNTSGVCLFWRDDGTNPTNAAGVALAANQTMAYSVIGLPIKLIAASAATCTATISYYQ